MHIYQLWSVEYVVMYILFLKMSNLILLKNSFTSLL